MTVITIDKVVSVQFTVQFVHVGQGSDLFCVTIFIACVGRDGN